jgi:hypothetical protein
MEAPFYRANPSAATPKRNCSMDCTQSKNTNRAEMPFDATRANAVASLKTTFSLVEPSFVALWHFFGGEGGDDLRARGDALCKDFEKEIET